MDAQPDQQESSFYQFPRSPRTAWVELGILLLEITELDAVSFKELCSNILDRVICELVNQEAIRYALVCKAGDESVATFKEVSLRSRTSFLHELMTLEERNIVKMDCPRLLPNLQEAVMGNDGPLYLVSSPTAKNCRLGIRICVRQDFLERASKRIGVKCEDLATVIKEQIKEQKMVIEITKLLITEKLSQSTEREIEQALSARFSLGRVVSPQRHQQCLSKEQLQDLVNPEDKKNKNVLNVGFNEMEEAGEFFALHNMDPRPLPTPAGFSGEIKPYQNKALKWMLSREGQVSIPELEKMHTPYWWDAGKDLERPFPLMLNSDKNYISYGKPVLKVCDGGILADEMGLGKTVMIIALMLAHPGKPNLILAPLSIIDQWKSQIQIFAPSLNVIIYHGQYKNIKTTNFENYDVVISTEGRLRGQYQKRQKDLCPMLKQEWFRIIIDEAHNFKNSSTNMAKAACSLLSQYRWCLSGTPLQNSLDDIYSLVKFLKFYPWSDYSYWKNFFPKDPKKTSKYHYINAKKVLSGIMLRRRKKSKDDEGRAILKLPEVNIKIHYVEMDKQTREKYRIFDIYAQTALKQIWKLDKAVSKEQRTKKQEKKKVNKLAAVREERRRQYNYIFSLLAKMRMICCHVFLSDYSSSYIKYADFPLKYQNFIKRLKLHRYPKYNFFEWKVSTAEERRILQSGSKNLWDVYDDWKEIVYQIGKGSKTPCQKCGSLLDVQYLTPCFHFYCKKCIFEPLEHIFFQKLVDYGKLGQKQGHHKPRFKQVRCLCPCCQQKVSFQYLHELPKLNEFNRSMDEFKQNEKIMTLIEYLKEMKDHQKALIYTSFLGMLSLISHALDKNNIIHRTLQGQDSLDKRSVALKEFKQNPSVRVLIITLKTGSVGLNLQAASKVFFMEPWWNPAIEDQAVSRAHRDGQQQKVQAIKFITKESIEARIVKLGLEKKKLMDSVLDIDDINVDTRYSLGRHEIKVLLGMPDTENYLPEEEDKEVEDEGEEDEEEENEGEKVDEQFISEQMDEEQIEEQQGGLVQRLE